MPAWTVSCWWLVAAFLAAAFRSMKDLGFKEILTDTSSLEGALVFWIFTLPFIVPFALARTGRKMRMGLPIVSRWDVALRWTIVSSSINVVAYWMFLEALRLSDFSIATVLRNTVPLFGFVIAVWILKQRTAAMLNLVATVLVVVGVVVVHTTYSNGGLHIEGVFSFGSILAFLCAALFACAVLCETYVMKNEHGGLDILCYVALLMVFSTIGYAILVGIVGSYEEVWRLIGKYVYPLLGIGLLGTMGSIFTASAIAHGEMIKVIPALRVQVLISVGIGIFYFGEDAPEMRIIGALVLTTGLVLVARSPKPKAEPKPS